MKRFSLVVQPRAQHVVIPVAHRGKRLIHPAHLAVKGQAKSLGGPQANPEQARMLLICLIVLDAIQGIWGEGGLFNGAYEAVGILISRVKPQPRSRLQIRFRFVGHRPDAKVLEIEQVGAERGIVELQERRVAFGADVVNGCVIGDRELCGWEKAHRDVASCHRSPPGARSHHLTVRISPEAIGPDGGFAQDEAARACRVGKSTVEGEELLLGK